MKIYVIMNEYNYTYYSGKTVRKNGMKYLDFGLLETAKHYTSKSVAENAVRTMKANPNISGTDDIIAVEYMIDDVTEMVDNEINITVETKRKIKTVPITGTKLVKWYETKTTKCGRKTNSVRTCGITSNENINLVNGLDCISGKIKADNMYEGYAYVMAIKKENYKKVCSGIKHITDDGMLQNINSSNIDSDEYMLLLWNVGSYRIADLNHNILALPIMYGYIDGRIDNYNYDLEKLLKILKENPYILCKDELKISDIPYYNAERGRTQTIYFQMLIPDKEYEKVNRLDSYTMRSRVLEQFIPEIESCKIDHSNDEDNDDY